MVDYKKILDSVVIDIRNIAEEEQRNMSHFVYQALWHILVGIDHDLKEPKK